MPLLPQWNLKAAQSARSDAIFPLLGDGVLDFCRVAFYNTKGVVFLRRYFRRASLRGGGLLK